MRFMVIVKASKDSEAGILPSAELLRDMGKFNEELAKSGRLLAAEGLQPSSKGARIRYDGDKKRTVIDGPFSETKELIAGFWLIEAKNLDEVVELMKRVPNPHDEAGEIEIRPVFEAEDFGEELNAAVPEVFEAERKARARDEARRAERQSADIRR